MASLWREHRARWTLPLVIIVIIGLVADRRPPGYPPDQPGRRPAHVTAGVGHAAAPPPSTSTGPWSGFNPNTPAGADSSTPTLLSSVLPSAYVINPKLIPEVNTDLLTSVEATLAVATHHPVRHQPQGGVVRRRTGHRR